MKVAAALAALAIGWATPVLAQEPTAEPAPILAVETELITFKLIAAEAEKADPRLLNMAIESGLKRFEQSLALAIERREYDQRPTWWPSALEIESHASFDGARLLSLIRVIYANDGGAHPNFEFASLLWDRRLDRELAVTDLFLGDRPPESLRSVWRAELVRMKNERFGGPEGEAMLDEYLAGDPVRLEETPFALAASTVPGKAGGILFLHAPYEVGAYVEGAYEVLVPLAAFRGALRLRYRGSFEGAPAVEPPPGG